MVSLKNHVVMVRTVDPILLNLKRNGYRRMIRTENIGPISAFDYKGKRRILCPDKHMLLTYAYLIWHGKENITQRL